MSPLAPTLIQSRRNPVSGWFADRKVNTKVLISIGTVSAVAIAIGATAVSALSAENHLVEQMNDEVVVPAAELSTIHQTFTELRLEIALHAFTTNASGKEVIDEEIAETEAELAAAIELYKGAGVEGEEEPLGRFEDALSEYEAVFKDELLPASHENIIAEYMRIREEVAASAGSAASEAIDELEDLQLESADEHVATSTSAFITNRSTLLITLVVGLALAIALGLYVSRLSVGPLVKVRDVLTQMAEGDLTGNIEATSRDEVGQMAGALSRALKAMRAAMVSVGTSLRRWPRPPTSSPASPGSSRPLPRSPRPRPGSGGLHPGDLPQRQRGRPGRGPGRHRRRGHQRHGHQARRVLGGDRQRREGHHLHRRADRPARAQRQHRGRPRRRCRQGLRRGRQRGQGPRPGDRKATEDIARRVETIQSDTSSAVEAIAHISNVIASINDYQVTIAAAVEEQTATTNEMNRNVAEAATGSTEIAANITGIATAAHGTTVSVSDSQRAVDELARMSSELQGLVGRVVY